ncbi:hypothetical protein ACLOJK_022769 [Asimina triloba]
MKIQQAAQSSIGSSSRCRPIVADPGQILHSTHLHHALFDPTAMDARAQRPRQHLRSPMAAHHPNDPIPVTTATHQQHPYPSIWLQRKSILKSVAIQPSMTSESPASANFSEYPNQARQHRSSHLGVSDRSTATTSRSPCNFPTAADHTIQGGQRAHHGQSDSNKAYSNPTRIAIQPSVVTNPQQYATFNRGERGKHIFVSISNMDSMEYLSNNPSGQNTIQSAKQMTERNLGRA